MTDFASCDEPFERITRSARPDVERFGPWWFDRSTLTLNLIVDVGGPEWQVDLEQRTTNDVALAWLAEFAHEEAATPERLGWLAFALNELLPPKEGQSDPRQRLGGLGWLYHVPTK